MVPSRLKYFWGRLSLAKKLYLIFGGMGLIIVLELLTLKYALSNLGAVRAFVYGESVWSKAQKDSAYYLQRYARTHDEEDFEKYRDSLFVPLECRKARLELYKENPDQEIIWRGFLNGKIHPDDVGPILHMIKVFAFLPHIQTALTTWREADEILMKFEAAADRLRNAIRANAPAPVLDGLILEIHELNLDLGMAEDRFSEALQEGARWLETVLLITLSLLVFFVEIFGFLLIFFFGSSLSDSIRKLIHRSEKISRGEFESDLPITSDDEVGQLTRSINVMGKTIATSKSELEATVAERTEALKEAMRMRDEFYTIATHELKTPVAGIQLSLQMLERKLSDPNSEFDRENVLSRISKAVELSRKLTDLQDTLMDVTRISGGLLTIQKNPEDLVPVIRQAMEHASLGEKVEMLYEGPERLLASFDTIRLGQVITNLLKNAVKYGGSSPVRITVTQKVREIHIEITDEGPGIPPEHQKRIFEPFVRANRDAGVSGLGMGLYISRKIMEAHGGGLEVSRSSAEGTTFRATLPSA